MVPVEIPDHAVVEQASPASIPAGEGKEGGVHAMLERALRGERRRIDRSRGILVVVDDHTRVTPVHALLPPVLSVARDAGKPVEILVAGGSHRAMTVAEKVAKLGAAVVDTVPVIDHGWDREDGFEHLGQLRVPGCEPIECFLNARACDPITFLVATGNIVPHRVVGFSGGYKILLPGLTRPATMNAVHYASARFTSEEILGIARNPVRDLVNSVHQLRPIDFLINTVLDSTSRVVSLCVGDPIASQYQGAAVARDVYGVPVARPARVVIADTVPEHVDFWVCAKAATNCKAFVERRGDLILFAPCTEGWAPGHENILLKHGYRDPATIDAMVRAGEIDPAHLIEASHLVHLGEVLSHCRVHVVSDTLARHAAGREAFDIVRTTEVNDLVSMLCKAPGTLVKVVARGAEILPIPARGSHDSPGGIDKLI